MLVFLETPMSDRTQYEQPDLAIEQLIAGLEQLHDASERFRIAIIHWLKVTDADQKKREATVSRINAIPTADLDMLCVQPQPDCEGAEHPYRSGFWMREGGNWRIVVGTMVSCHPDYCGFRGDEFVSGFTDNTFCEVGDVLPRGQWQMVAQLPSRCDGCGLEETHKMCPAHGTPAYMNKEHWGWGSVYGLFKLKSEMKDQRIAELEQAIAQERHQAKVYRLEMVKAQEEVKTHLRLIAGLVEALHE